MVFINTEKFSDVLRSRIINLDEKKILVTHLAGSEQEKDLTSPVNCDGYGRIRHFRLQQYEDWSFNPLPILPAAKALGYEHDTVLRVQVFQNAACNWRCWYCFVDFDRLSADRRVSEFFTADELIQKFMQEEDGPHVIDLSGGQPDLVPEWVLWTMQALKKYRLDNKIYLWSDDNLSNRYFWKYLTQEQRRNIAAFPKYSRVACFKGYDADSFKFNTLAAPELFDQQFEIYRDLLREGIDMYAYVTFTAVPHDKLQSRMEQFVDRLQGIHQNLPLRTVPLKIGVFTPTKNRIKQDHELALNYQYEVHHAWLEQIHKRFSKKELSIPICDIPMVS
jgi:uncharacterized Fe-S cluster-containing radical SAM superfamily protein